LLLIAMASQAQENGTFTDKRDGKVYKTVKIEKQLWMAENLAYKPNEGNYRAFGNDQNNVEKYGYLYDYETSKNVCPTGWHLPDKSEFQTLLNFINGCSSTNYKALIEGGTTNFNAQLSGLYTYKFEGKNIETFFWSKTQETVSSIYGLSLHYHSRQSQIWTKESTSSCSVRCIRD